MPPLPRYVGIPLSADIPAPVKKTMRWKALNRTSLTGHLSTARAAQRGARRKTTLRRIAFGGKGRVFAGDVTVTRSSGLIGTTRGSPSRLQAGPSVNGKAHGSTGARA